jgi:hypothetical protein
MVRAVGPGLVDQGVVERDQPHGIEVEDRPGEATSPLDRVIAGDGQDVADPPCLELPRERAERVAPVTAGDGR